MRPESLQRLYRFISAPHVDPAAPAILRNAYSLTTLITAMSVLFFVPLFFLWGDIVAAEAILVAAIPVICSPLLLRLTGSLAFVWHWIGLFNFSILAFLTFHQGGVDSSPAVWWLLLMPFGQLTAGLNRSAVWWLIGCILTVAVFFGVEQSGYELASQRGNNPQLLYFFSIVGLIIISMAYLIPMDRLRRQAYSQLEMVNSDLAQARDAAVTAVMAKSRFLANMSHEIRTPLHGVLGTAQLLGKSSLDSEQGMMVRTLISSGTTLLNLINDVLDFSRIEAGQLSLDEVAFSPGELVEDVADLLAAQASEKRIALSSRIMAGIPLTVRGDPNRLRQILTNLLANAIKFTQQGEVEIAVAPVAVQNDSHIRIRFDVRDTGIGIDPEHHENLFDAFSQADTSTTRVFGGSGLGLAISRELVALMGGSIAFDSTPGVGSHFSCEIPFGVDETAIDEGQRTSTQADAKLPVDLCAVVIEPHHASRVAVEEKLKQLGATVYTLLPPVSMDALRVATSRANCRLLVDHTQLTDDPPPGAAGLNDFLSLPCPTTVMVPYGARNIWRARGTADVTVVNKPVRLSALMSLFSMALDTEVAAERAEENVRGDGSSVRVLLAEDNTVNQQITVAMLERIGCSVDVVSDGNAAVRASLKAKYDLILMDCQMPVMDGFDATRAIRLREQQTHTGRVPIIALTASALTGDREACAAAGMDDYISKPFQIVQLQQTVLQWAEQNRTN